MEFWQKPDQWRSVTWGNVRSCVSMGGKGRLLSKWRETANEMCSQKVSGQVQQVVKGTNGILAFIVKGCLCFCFTAAIHGITYTVGLTYL